MLTEFPSAPRHGREQPDGLCWVLFGGVWSQRPCMRARGGGDSLHHLSLHSHRGPPQGCGEWGQRCSSGGGDPAVPRSGTCPQPAAGPRAGGKGPSDEAGLGGWVLTGGAEVTVPLFSRAQCLQASQGASGGFPEPTAASMRAAWTVSWPGTPTVPGTPSPEPAAWCPAPSRECRSRTALEAGLLGPSYPVWGTVPPGVSLLGPRLLLGWAEARGLGAAPAAWVYLRLLCPDPHLPLVLHPLPTSVCFKA